MKRQIVIHPFLFAIYPIIALYTYNIDQVFILEIRRSLLLTLGIVVALLLLLRIIRLDWERAGMISSLIFILFFSFGHVYSLILGNSIRNTMIGRSDILAAIWASILILIIWFILRKLRDTTKISGFLNMISILMLIIPMYRITQFTFQNTSISVNSKEASDKEIEKSGITPLKPVPDIYYIIVDGYGRQDVLDRLYQFDNSQFLEHLVTKGFCIANQSHSNYPQTALSLASSLNFEYVHNLINIESTNVSDRSPLAELIKQNRVRSELQDIGYKIVAYESGYPITEWNDADVYILTSTRFNNFETMLLSSSVAVLVFDHFIPKWYRERILTILDNLTNVQTIDSPKFVFAHITAPHPPFVFGPNGEPRPSQGFREGNYFEGTIDEYIEGYRGQVTYLNNRLIEITDTILDNAVSDPIIIIQADHGPGAYLNWDSLEGTCLSERMSILNAYYLPDGGCAQLYPSITPINTFPLIFNYYFNLEYNFISDDSYFSHWTTPYDLINITDSIDTCNHPKIQD